MKVFLYGVEINVDGAVTASEIVSLINAARDWMTPAQLIDGKIVAPRPWPVKVVFDVA